MQDRIKSADNAQLGTSHNRISHQLKRNLFVLPFLLFTLLFIPYDTYAATAANPNGGTDPTLEIEVSINGDIADNPPGVQLLIGDTATWSYFVVNNSTGSIDGVEIVDDNGTSGDTSDDIILTLKKIVINDNDGTETADAWILTATPRFGGAALSGNGTLVPGSSGTMATISFEVEAGGQYALSESGPGGYQNSGDWQCATTLTNGSIFSFPVRANSDSDFLGVATSARSITCEITNDDIEPPTGSITIKKNVVGDDFSDMAFDFTLNSMIEFELSENDAAGFVKSDLDAGTYPVVETVPDGWELTSIDCGTGQNNVDITNGVNIVLEAGEDVVCTFNNTPITTAVALASLSATAIDDGVLVAWSTAIEIDNAGFNLYASAAAEGPWVKLNDGLITARGSATDATEYAFRAGSTAAYFMLEDIDTSGVATRHGPIAPNSVSNATTGQQVVFLPVVR